MAKRPTDHPTTPSPRTGMPDTKLPEAEFRQRFRGRFADPAFATETDAAAYATAEEVLEGRSRDPTGGALYFHGEGVIPHSSKVFHLTARIGGHVFYSEDRRESGGVSTS